MYKIELTYYIIKDIYLWIKTTQLSMNLRRFNMHLKNLHIDILHICEHLTFLTPVPHGLFFKECLTWKRIIYNYIFTDILRVVATL